MFLNDAVLEPYGAALFGMSLCATTALNALMAMGFFVGLGLSGFVLVERMGNIRTAQLGAVLAVTALALMCWRRQGSCWASSGLVYALWPIAWHLYPCQLHLDV